jgi:hypothetical protein
MPDSQNEEEKIRRIVEDIVHQEIKKENKQEAPQGLSPEDQKAAVDCTNAHNIALQTFHYCQTMGGGFVDPENLNVLQDCAELCELMDSFILRQSRLKADLSELCFRACDACVKLAEKFSSDEQMKTLFQYAKIASESVKKVK